MDRARVDDQAMCNLYSVTRPQAEMRRLFEVEPERDTAGNLPTLPAVFPDQMAPVVITGEQGRELTTMRWGIPGPKAFGEHPVTNVRNVKSPHWRPWTGVRGTKAENPDREAAEHRLFSFLTCEPNGIVAPVHPKAMPVLLTTPDEWRTWLEAPTEEALALQRPLPDGEMTEVARGHRSDG